MKKYLFIIISILALHSCGNKQNAPAEQEKVLKIYCDEGFYNRIKVPSNEFDSINYRLKIELISTPAYNCMAKLMSGDAQAVILSRGYSTVEDSLMKAFKVPPYTREPIAHDALVFYTNSSVLIDTVSDKQLKAIFTNTADSFEKLYPKSGISTIVCNSQLSSEYFNLKKFLLNNKQIAKKLVFFNTSDSVKNYVKNNKNSVGIGYLSQLYLEPDLKPIQVSFTDSTGKYIYPMKVHQANIVRGFYPYTITHYIYLFDNKADAPLAYARYISKSAAAQRYFNEIGIVPAFGNIRLIQE